jgi:hypothetical protein
MLRDATLARGSLGEHKALTADEVFFGVKVLNPHGEQRGNVARLEP